MAIAGWEPHKAVAAGRTLRGLTQQDLATRLGQVTGMKWTRAMVASLEIGKKALSARTLSAIGVILDLPYSYFLQGVEEEFRALNRAIPGYDNPATLRDRISRRILKSDHSRRFHCFDCLLDPDFHVLAEWLEPAGVLPQVPGQTEFIINIEKMLEEVA